MAGTFAIVKATVQRVVSNAIAPRKANDRPVALPRRSDYQTFLSGDLTPERVGQILDSTLWGNLTQQNDAFDRMLERDAHIRCEYEKRMMAVTGLNWDVVSASQVREGDLSDDQVKVADEIAAYVRMVLRRIVVSGFGFERPVKIGGGLRHLLDAIGRGVSGIEQIWDTVELSLPGQTTKTPVRAPVAWNCLAARRFRYDSLEPWRLRILLNDTDATGLAIDEQIDGKFIVHAPKPIGGRGARGALHRPALIIYMVKTNEWKFALIASEIFGQPIRIAKYPSSATQAEKDEIMRMLNELGASAGGMFSDGTQIEVINSGFTSGGAQSIYERFIKICDAAASKNYIGNALTTELQSADGSKNQPTMAADGVRDDIRDDDIAAECSTITEQFIRPLIAASPYADRGGMELLPEFKRIVPEPVDDRADMELAALAQKMGKAIPVGWFSERFAYPLIDGEDPKAALVPATGFDPTNLANQLGETGGPTGNRKLQPTSNGALEKIARRSTAIARIVPWILTAAFASTAHVENVQAAIATGLKREEGAIVTEADVGPALARIADDCLHTSTAGDFAELNRQMLLAAQLAGRADAQKHTARRGRNSRRTRNAAEIDFAKIPFVKAIESLRDRIGLEPDVFESLDAEARSLAFRVAGVTDMDLLAVVHDAMVRAIQQGRTSREFRLDVLPQMYDRNGWSGENPWHSELVFYQNSYMAFGAGRYREFQESGIEAYQVVGNGESCEICEPEVGKIYPISATKNFGGFHFHCDCDVEPLFEGEYSAADISDPDAGDNEALKVYRSKPGSFQWDVASYGGLRPVALGEFPEPLRPAFERLAKEKGWPVA